MTHLHEEIRDLKSRMTEMASAVEEMVRDAIRSVVARDSRLAREVIARDNEVDELEIEIDEMAVRLLACYQPMAVDLRFIVNASKIVGILERMADLATKIAEAALRLNTETRLRTMDDVFRMAELSQAMIRDAIRAFTESDARLARQVRDRDDDVDRYRDRIFESCKRTMKDDSGAVECCVSVILIARALERLADQSTNIAEDIVHYVEGVVIKHHHDTPGTTRA
jgi:phosphate transport system protein